MSIIFPVREQIEEGANITESYSKPRPRVLFSYFHVANSSSILTVVPETAETRPEILLLEYN